MNITVKDHIGQPVQVSIQMDENQTYICRVAKKAIQSSTLPDYYYDAHGESTSRDAAIHNFRENLAKQANA